MLCDESWIYCYDPETKWKHAGSPRPKKARQSKSTHKHLMIPFFLTALAWSTRTGFPLDRQSIRNTMLTFSGSSGSDSVGRGWHSSNRVSGISTRTMHQSTTPSLSQTIWPRWASRQFLTLPIVQTLLPVTFVLFPKLKKNLRGCCYETIEEMKEAVTKVTDTLIQEDFHGAFKKLLERYNKWIAAGGDYFEGD